MRERTAHLEGLRWAVEDSTNMPHADETFDVVVDKAVFDALAGVMAFCQMPSVTLPSDPVSCTITIVLGQLCEVRALSSLAAYTVGWFRW